MGAINPKTGRYERIVAVITADGNPPKKGEDVIGYKLESGDSVGFGDLTAYNTERAEIEMESKEEMLKLQNTLRNDLLTLHQTFMQRGAKK